MRSFSPKAFIDKYADAKRRSLLLVLIPVIALTLVALAIDGAASPVQSYMRAAENALPAQQNNGILAIVGAEGAGLYDTPAGTQIRLLPAGTVLTAVGRSADSSWVVVNTSDGQAGWVEVRRIVIFGVDQLPVMYDAVPAATSAPTGEAPSGTPPSLPTPTFTPTAPPTPTFTPTPLPTPTFTATPIPTATLTPTPAPLPAGGQSSAPSGSARSLVAVVRGGGAPLYDRPGGTQIAQLDTGTALSAVARTPDSAWLVVLAAADQVGWVEAARVVIFNADELPVMDPNAQAGGSGAVGVPPPTTPTATPVGAASSGPIPIPTGASGVVTLPTPTAVSSVRPTPAFEKGDIVVTVVTDDSRLNLRSGPGTEFVIVGKAADGEQFRGVGRNGAATWVLLEAPDLPDGIAWAVAEFVDVSVPVVDLPVSDRQGSADPAPETSPAAPSPGNAVSASVTSGSWTGTLVLQGSAGGAIYVYEFDSGTLRELTGGFDPAISPDGSTVAFTRVGGEHGLYLIDIDGSNERLIFSGSEGLRGPTWSPDGAWIAFSRISGEYRCRDVGFGICLPDNPFLDSFPLSTRPDWGLSRVDRDGQNFRDLPALTSAQAANWHANGIVYQSNTGLEITQDQPAAQTQLLVSAPYYQDPNWQPGGDRIIFQSREGNHWEIFTINGDGSGLSALTRPVTALVDELPNNVSPAWSHDGQWIAYLSSRDENNSAGPWRLWIMDAGGGNQTPLDLGIPFEYSYGNEQMVSWGP